MSASLDACEARDVKGLYKKARAGEIKNFTGISDPYEAPKNPDLDIPTDKMHLEESVNFVFKRLIDEGIVESTRETHIAKSLIEENLTEEQLKEFAGLKTIDIDVEQAEYIQTLGQGWAYPLNKFMDEIQLLEVIQMKTLTDSDGNKHLFSVPITQSVTKEQKE